MNKRTYEMRARAESTAETRARLIRAAIDAVNAERSVMVTLNAIAERAGVSAHTALRHFGSRDALMDAAIETFLAEVIRERRPPPEDRDAALDVLLRHYELRGDAVLGVLGEEDREPHAKAVTDLGRREHRSWVEQVFARAIASAPDADQEALVDLLVVATDVYTWKLLRRDRGLSVEQVHDRLVQLNWAIAPEPLRDRGIR